MRLGKPRKPNVMPSIPKSQYKEKAIADGAIVNSVDTAPFAAAAKGIQDTWAEKHGMTETLQQIRNMQ